MMNKNNTTTLSVEQLENFQQPVLKMLLEYEDRLSTMPEVSTLLRQVADLLNNTANMALSVLRLAAEALLVSNSQTEE